MERQPLSFRLVLFILAYAFEFAEFIQSMSTPKKSFFVTSVTHAYLPDLKYKTRA